MNLLQILVQKGILPEKDLPAVKEAQKAAPSKALHTLLIEGGFLKEEDILPVLAEQFGMDLVDLTGIKIEPERLAAMPLQAGASSGPGSALARERHAQSGHRRSFRRLCPG